MTNSVPCLWAYKLIDEDDEISNESLDTISESLLNGTLVIYSTRPLLLQKGSLHPWTRADTDHEERRASITRSTFTVSRICFYTLHCLHVFSVYWFAVRQPIWGDPPLAAIGYAVKEPGCHESADVATVTGRPWYFVWHFVAPRWGSPNKSDLSPVNFPRMRFFFSYRLFINVFSF